jgi:hypothetical protein
MLAFSSVPPLGFQDESLFCLIAPKASLSLFWLSSKSAKVETDQELFCQLLQCIVCIELEDMCCIFICCLVIA